MGNENQTTVPAPATSSDTKTVAPANKAATPEKKRITIMDIIKRDDFQAQIKTALPKILTPERFTRVALTAIVKNPKLLECNRESVLLALYKAAELGLEPDGRRAHLIPYKQECQLIIDYKGKVELALRSGSVSTIHADAVCDKGAFEYDRGELKKHTIDFRSDRGAPYAYYCLVRMKDGTEICAVMSIKEIELVRKRSKAANSGPWVTDFDEMAKKTVFHRVSKWLVLSPELRRAEELDDDEPMDTPKKQPPLDIRPIS